MKAPLAIFCVALLLAGCRAGPEGGFFQTRVPPPGTQPAGFLLADNLDYPSAQLSAPQLTANDPLNPLSPTGTGTFAPMERRGAPLGRAPSHTSTRSTSAAGEVPIRIVENSPLPAGLAAVVPIRGIPTTDVAGRFQTAREGGASDRAQPAPSGYVEISQLRDPHPDLRGAYRFSQPLR